LVALRLLQFLLVLFLL